MNIYHQDEELAYPGGHGNSGQTWAGPNNITLSNITVDGSLGSLTLTGTTSINQSTLDVNTCPLINNGTTNLNHSNLDVYALQGNGTIKDYNHSNVTINHTTGFTSSETILLDGSSSLNIIGGAPKLSFLKNVGMVQGSTVVLEGLGKITAEIYSHGMLELFTPHSLAASLNVTAPRGTEIWATQSPTTGYVTLTDSMSPPAHHIPVFT